MTDRVVERWRRAEIPPKGSDKFARLAWLAFPTDYLSRNEPAAAGGMSQIPPAPQGMAAFVEIGLSRDTEDIVRLGTMAADQAAVVVHCPTFDDISVFVRWYHGQWENKDVRVPASHGRPAYRFLASDPSGGARPVRLTTQSLPRDGDAIHVTEVGGCVDAP